MKHGKQKVSSPLVGPSCDTQNLVLSELSLLNPSQNFENKIQGLQYIGARLQYIGAPSSSWLLENRKHLHVLNVLELTPRAPIPDGRMEQIMQPWRLGIFWIRNRAEMNIFTNQRYALRISQVRIHKRLFPWYYSINISASKLRNMCNPQIGYLLEKTEN